MILADTSVWVDHLRTGNKTLAGLLGSGAVLVHPSIIGELALGHLKRPRLVLEALANLPTVRVATDREVLHLIAAESLAGSGIGYVDAHLLAAVRLTPGSFLWTRDRRLRGVGLRLALCVDP